MNDQKNKQQQSQQDKEKGQGNMKEQGNRKDKNQQDPQKVPHNTSHKPNMTEGKWEQPVGSDIENPDKENDPEKKVNIDDDPEQTKKKVPNMGK